MFEIQSSEFGVMTLFSSLWFTWFLSRETRPLAFRLSV